MAATTALLREGEPLSGRDDSVVAQRKKVASAHGAFMILATVGVMGFLSLKRGMPSQAPQGDAAESVLETSSAAAGAAGAGAIVPSTIGNGKIVKMVQLEANVSLDAFANASMAHDEHPRNESAFSPPAYNTTAALANASAIHWASTQCGQYGGMLLACTITVGVNAARLGDKAIEATVAYRVSGSDTWLYSAVASINGEKERVTLDIVRLRPNAEYEAKILTAFHGGGVSELAHGKFTSMATGITEFDDGPICNITGRTPTFGVLYFDVQMGDFQGVVAIDSAGWVVWYYQVMISGESYAVMAFDKFPDHRFLVQAVGMEPWGYSEMMVVNPTSGEMLASRVTGCSGDPENYTQFTHEARVRPNQGDVVTVEEFVTKVSNIAAADGAEKVEIEGLGSVEYVFDDVISAWKPDVTDDNTAANDDGAQGELTVMYRMLHYFDPVSNDVDAVNSYTLTKAMCGTEDGDISVLDWSHVSAISFAEEEGFYLISMRNIDTVAAIDATTGDLKWALSSHSAVSDDFSWDSEDDKFYNVHSAYIVEQTDYEDDAGTANVDGKLRLLLFDGGNNRPGCHLNYTGCFSRAIEYTLDTDAGTVETTWQFAYPYGSSAGQRAERQSDTFVEDGGSVVLFANDANDEKLYYAGFTSTAKAGWGAHAFIFIVDGHGSVHTEISVRQHYWNAVAAGLYRTLPSKSLTGEGEDFPFTTSHPSSLPDAQ